MSEQENVDYVDNCMDALNCPPLWVSFGLNPGGAGAGPWRGLRAVARQYCIPTTPCTYVYIHVYVFQ
jgi:hypothetical protein